MAPSQVRRFKGKELNLLLKIALLLPARVRTALKVRFPRIATLVLTKSSTLSRWKLKQERLRTSYDAEAERMDIPDFIGNSDSARELVIVTPTPPIKSGISKYSSKLVNELSELVQVRIVSSLLDPTKNVYSPGIRATFPDVTDEFTSRKIIYMLGNGEHHWRTWDLLLKIPGYIVIHDARIPDIPLMPGEDHSWYELSYQEKSSRFLGRIPLHTLGIYCHSEAAADLVKSQMRDFQRNKIFVKVLSTGHPVDLSVNFPRVPKRPPIIGTFGFQTQNKNPVLTYLAISRIAYLTNGRGLICGKIDSRTKNLAKSIWLNAGNSPEDLAIYDWVDDITYSELMSSVDLGIQLRSSSNGESSGPVSELNSLGIPTVVTDIGSFAEIPDFLEGVFKIPEKIFEADLDHFLKPVIDLMINPVKYQDVSSKLLAFHKNKTYKHLAEELVTEIFN